MSISLTKGNSISLRKEAPSITKFYIALGWLEEAGVDPDVSAFLCKTGSSGEPVLYPNDAATDMTEHDYGNLVFFNNKQSVDGAVKHGGDNRNGKNDPRFVGTPMEDDDESITVDISSLDSAVDEISFVVTIDGAAAKGQTFQNVRQSFIRICENDGMGREIARFKLDESYTPNTAVQFGSLVKESNGWNFSAVGEGYGSRKSVVTFEDVVAQYLVA